MRINPTSADLVVARRFPLESTISPSLDFDKVSGDWQAWYNQIVKLEVNELPPKEQKAKKTAKKVR